MRLLSWLVHPSWRGIYLGLACGLLAWAATQTGMFRGLEDWMLDTCFSWRGARKTAARVVIVGIDEASLRALGKPLVFTSPELGEVVAHLHAQGASAIGLDVLVPDYMTALRDIADEGGRGEALSLSRAIQNADNVVLPEILQGGDQPPLRPLLHWRRHAILRRVRGQGRMTDLGFVNLTEDDDQFVRRQLLLARYTEDGETTWSPQFALALLGMSRGADVSWDEQGRPRVGDLPAVPLDHNGRLRINFIGPPGTVPVLPFREVLAGARQKQPLPEVQGAVVVIGLTADSGQDRHPTPYANHYARWFAAHTPGLMSGPELHANVFATLHDQAFITTPSWLHPLFLVLVVGAALGHALTRLSLSRGLALVTAHHFAWKAVAFLAFALAAWRVEMVAMLLTGFLVGAAGFAMRWRRLRRMLGVVKSEAVARILESDPERLDRAGEKRQVTVLFADVRGFTAFSQRIREPHEIVGLLNAYFDVVVPILEAEGGTVDKYMGDGLMVLFGTPARCADHAVRAVRAAVAMVQAVRKLNETRAGDPTWQQLGAEGLRIGVGIDTGEVVIGALGSKGRLDYTAIGPTVNTASRLEAQTKGRDDWILISEATQVQLGKQAGTSGVQEPGVTLTLPGAEQSILVYPVPVP